MGKSPRRAGALVALAAASCAGTYQPAPLSTLALEGQVPREASPLPTSSPDGRPAATTARPALLSLPQVIQLCVLREPRIQMALASIRLAQGDYTTAALLPNPGLLVDGVFIPLARGFSADRPGGPTQMDFVLSYQIDGILFGKRRTAMESARRAVDVAMADYADTIRQRIIDAVNSYYDVLQTRNELALARDAEAQARKVKDITEARVTLGSVGAIELDRTRLAVLSAHRDVLRAEAELDKARSRLRARVGARPEDGPVDVAGELDVSRSRPPPSLAAALAAAEETRPDLLSARRAVEKAAADIRAQKAVGYPQLSVGVGASVQNLDHQDGAAAAPSMSLSLQSTLPVFDRNQGGIAKARAALWQAQENLRAVRIGVRAEVEQALREYQVSFDIVSKDDAATLAAAGAARDKVQQSYKLGGRTLLEVLDAQQAYREAMRLSIASRAGYFRALHGLNAAVGKEMP